MIVPPEATSARSNKTKIEKRDTVFPGNGKFSAGKAPITAKKNIILKGTCTGNKTTYMIADF